MAEAALILLPLVLAHFAAAVSPGPSFVLIARTAAARSRGAAMRMSIGLGLGAMLWAAAALFGLTILFEIAPWTYLAMKIAGAAFLLWLGVQLWRHAPEALDMTLTGQEGLGAGGDIRHGFLVQIANPKVSIFFGSVFVTLVPPEASPLFLAVLLSLVFVVETAWYLFVSTFFAVPQIRARYLRLKAWIDRACGGVLGLLGLRLAIS